MLLFVFGKPLLGKLSGALTGPAFPPIPVDAGKVFPFLYVGAGSTWKHTYGLGVMPSVNADCTWRMAFLMRSGTLPAGVCKLQLWCRANANAGNAIVNPKWAMCASGIDPSSTTLLAEGPTTITWGSTDADRFKLTTITLDAATPQPGQMLLLDLVFQTSGWTLAQPSVWLPFIEFV